MSGTERIWNVENIEKVGGDGIKEDAMLQIMQGLTGHGQVLEFGGLQWGPLGCVKPGNVIA